MPTSSLGQLITFSVETVEDSRYRKWRWEPVKKGDTVAAIANRLGHPEDAEAIRVANGLKSVTSHFSGHKNGKKRIKVPAADRDSLTFHVLAGDGPPTVTGGYAKLSIVDRPERIGLTAFDGYDPITMDIPIRFEAKRDGGAKQGMDIERDIALLERMAGRGADFDGPGSGPAPIIHISTSQGSEVVPLIPRNYQRYAKNLTGPLWRIANISWDTSVGDGVLRNPDGNRVRQKAVVHVQQYTKLNLVSRSVTARSKTKTTKKTTKKKGKK